MVVSVSGRMIRASVAMMLEMELVSQTRTCYSISMTTGLQKAISDAIKAATMKRVEIADALGLSEGHVSRMVSGERGLSIETAERIADLLGYEIRLVKRKGR